MTALDRGTRGGREHASSWFGTWRRCHDRGRHASAAPTTPQRRPRVESSYDLRVAPGYLEFDGALASALAALEDGMPAHWWTHLFVHAADRALIGIGGYTGPPENGTVEIGYSIAPAYRGRGLATAAAAELINRAGAAGVRTVQAHTLAHANASTGVLGVLGFTRTAEIDSEDGPLWRWELQLGRRGRSAVRA